MDYGPKVFKLFLLDFLMLGLMQPDKFDQPNKGG